MKDLALKDRQFIADSKMPRKKMIEEYGDRLMLTEDEFREYSKGKKEITMLIYRLYRPPPGNTLILAFLP